MSGKDWLSLILLSVLWGGSFFFVGVAVPWLPPLTIVLIRVGLAALVLAFALPALGVALPRGRAVWAALLVMGFLNNVVPFSLYVVAQGQISSGLASILNATTPLWGVVVAHLATQDERLSWPKALGVLTGFAGVAVMLGHASDGGALWAQGACLCAALSYALAGVWARRFKAMGLAPLSLALGQLACATLILLPLVALIDRPWMLSLPPLPVMAALLGLAVLSTACAYGLYFHLIASAGAVNAFLVTFLVPVSAVALGIAFLGEALAPRHVAGMALIALGLLVLDGRLWRRVRARGGRLPPLDTPEDI
ncbi:DMT family transporter [Rhodobacter sp. NTK016B]|uniref:DMT family transporter n=1 Tax=Rhodobacter sp. NTK016B TaxID=2759676 RepID=UPI001A8EEF1C|nr:DMT family transporter [Rhodobacter sp. NTK016B]MBN8293045.1 DMT family transporter [Rhodobacter sp. NTK016B]